MQHARNCNHIDFVCLEVKGLSDWTFSLGRARPQASNYEYSKTRSAGAYSAIGLILSQTRFRREEKMQVRLRIRRDYEGYGVLKKLIIGLAKSSEQRQI